jgi:CheY-like chemotaxis protein
MKKMILFILAILSLFSPCYARDFIVQFVEENYKEAKQDYSNEPLVYHSIQVNSEAGSKLLILTGDNREYRKWLRQYIAGNKELITRVPENENDRFISSKAYEIDVTQIHPVNGNRWISDIPISSDVAALEGNNHILVIDANEKRTHLISTVIRKMGYSAMVFQNGAQTLKTFRVQPEKFKMIIVNHDLPGMNTAVFVDHILKIDANIPILIETGYNDPKTKNKFTSKFSTAGSVVVKPVVMEDLQKTITHLIKEKV